MGATRPSRPDQDGGWHLTTGARVVPDVPSFAVDGGFLYGIRDSFAPQIEVGSVVRVPLSGRRVRGWVVGLEATDSKKLKDVLGVSAPIPITSKDHLKTLRWAAEHYVAPMSVLLTRASPPNLPKRISVDDSTLPDIPVSDHPLAEIVAAVTAGSRMPTQVLVGSWRDPGWVTAFTPLLSAGRSAIVVTATAAEAADIGETAREALGSRVIVVSGGDDAGVTDAWERCQRGGVLLIGTPRVALWSVAELEMVVVLEEGRRAMKERQTPTLHVREVVRSRSLLEGAVAVFFGPTPSVELLATGAQPRILPGRPWPLVEVVTRTRDAPGSGLLDDQSVAAIRGMSGRGERTFILATHSMLDSYRDEVSRRLGEELGAMVTIGTERDLTGLERVGLAVAPYPAAISEGWGYRGTEEVLRVLSRLGNSVRTGHGHRLLVQTDDPGSSLVEALRRGEPLPYLERVLVDRAQGGLPPAVSMMALEIRTKVPPDVEEVLSTMDVDEVHGPLNIDDGKRWLLQGDLRVARRELRQVVGRWREAGSVVRIDADPIDL